MGLITIHFTKESRLLSLAFAAITYTCGIIMQLGKTTPRRTITDKNIYRFLLQTGQPQL